MSTATLSALTTVFVGAGQIIKWDWWFLAPLISSALISVFSAYDSFHRPKELWLQKTDTWMALKNLDANIKYAKAKSSELLSQVEVDEFYKRFDQTLVDEHALWMTVRAAREHVGIPALGSRGSVSKRPTAHKS